jgi:cell division protein ZapA (FtsZ GTPase activity inhibitor)
MGELSIKVLIAGRTYPLTIKKEEEESVRKAAKLINERVKEYEDNYSVRDKQDLLAMCALQIASQNLDLEKKAGSQNEEVETQLVEIDKLVSDYLRTKELTS